MLFIAPSFTDNPTVANATLGLFASSPAELLIVAQKLNTDDLDTLFIMKPTGEAWFVPKYKVAMIELLFSEIFPQLTLDEICKSLTKQTK